eukprot:7753370-Alexandrium_andersonii.AAC.1
MEALTVRNFFGAGVGREARRSLSIPQGCPWSMTVLGLVGAPWVRYIGEEFAATTARCLADDMLLETAPAFVDQTASEHADDHVGACEATV